MKESIKYYMIIFFIIITTCIYPTYAVELKDESSLEINFVTENDTLPMDNANVLIYKLASVDNESYLATWEDVYSNYEIDLGRSTDEKIISKAMELADFVKSNNINSDYKLTTDSNGKSKVTFENGIYLICGEKEVKNNITYTPVPCIIELPYTSEDGTLIYNASIKLKYERQEPEAPSDTQVPTKNQKGKNPGTGDNILIVVGILIIAIVLNILLILYEKRVDNKNDE